MVLVASQNSQGKILFYLTKYLRLIIYTVEVRGRFEVQEHHAKSQTYSGPTVSTFF